MSPNKTRKLSGNITNKNKSRKIVFMSCYLIFCRIFTVILYMFSVSLGAILLSLYYVFLWKNPHTQDIDTRVS